MLTKVISNKTLGFDKEKVLELVMANKDKENFLYRVFGVIEGHEIGQGKHKRVNAETGEAENTTWTKFFGEFAAIDKDGNTYEATTCFLPNYVNGKFVSELTGSDDGGLAIEFAFDVYAIYSKGSATSYEYLAAPVRKEGETSKLDAMKAAMGSVALLPGAAKPAQIESKGKGK